MDSKELIQYIVDNNLIENVLEKIGCHSLMNGKEIRCALPNDDDPSKVSVNKEKLSIRIFTKGESIHGNIYNLIMYIDNSEFIEAFKKCASIVGINNTTYKKSVKNKNPLDFFKHIKRDRKVETNNEGCYYDISILDKYDKTPHIDLIKKDGIFYDVIEKYNIKFDANSDRIVFPHFDYNDKNKIVGIIGRTVNPAYESLKIPKYLCLSNNSYEKSKNLYGLSHNIENIKKEGLIVVFEAEKSVLKADMFKYPIGVAVGCHEISPLQTKILIGLNVEIVIAFDKDVQEDHVINICKELSKYRKVSYIIDKYNLLKEKDSPVDRGHKKWEYLFRNRIIYK